MKIKGIKRIARRLGCETIHISEEGYATVSGTDFNRIGYYTGKDDSVLGTTIEVDPDDEYPKEWVYDETPMSKDFEKKCSETEMWNRLAKYADEYVKDDKDQEFNPLEYLFTGAPIMIEGCTEWFPYDKKYDHDNLRLPTIEESPLNMKLAWHPELRKPEGIDDYEYIIWHIYNDYPEECLIDWSRVTAFMLLKKK